MLNNYSQISFGEYGDWGKVFTDNEMYPVLWVAFLEDLISPDRMLEDSNKFGQDDMEIILQPLTSHLRDGQLPTLVAFSTW